MLATIVVISFSIYSLAAVLVSYLRHTIPSFFLPSLLAFSIILALTILYPQLKSQQRDRTTPEATRKQSITTGLLAILPFLAFLPGLLALLISTRVQISVHGFFHSGYVYQILNGFIPPENVTLPGYPVNNYWPYHAILAVLSQIIQTPPPLTASLLNILILFTSISLGYSLIRSITALQSLSGGIALAIFGLFGTNLFGIFHTWFDTDRNFIRPAVIAGDYRVANMFEKYLNVTGFPAGVMLYLFILVVLIRVIKEQRLSSLQFCLISVACLGALLIHTTTGLYILVTFPPALFAIYLIHIRRLNLQYLIQAVRRDVGALANQIKKPINLLILTTTSALAILVLYYVYMTSNALPAKSQLEWFSLDDVESILGVFYPLIPFFIWGIFLAWQRKELHVLLLAQVCLYGYVLTLITSLPDGNDYKFILLSTIIAGFVAALALEDLWHRPRLKGIVVIAVLLSLTNTLMVGIHRLRMPWFRDKTFSYYGEHVHANAQQSDDYRDLIYSDVFEWARQYTPTNSVIIVPVRYKDDSTLYLLSERTPYVVDGSIYNKTPVKLVRVDRVENLYSSATKGKEKFQIIQSIRRELPGRPILLIYPHDKRIPLRVLNQVDPRNVYTGKFANGYYFPALK